MMRRTAGGEVVAVTQKGGAASDVRAEWARVVKKLVAREPPAALRIHIKNPNF